MTTKLALWLITGGMVAILYFTLNKTNGTVSSKDAHQLVAAGASLLDVRTPAEYAAGHLPNAINIPVQELPGRMRELAPKDRPLVVYCRSGHRSAQAAKILQHAGFGEVHDLGGIDRW